MTSTPQSSKPYSGPTAALTRQRQLVAWIGRGGLRRVLGLLIGCAGLAVVLSGLAGSWHRYLDVASHLMWHGAGLFVGGTIAALWPRRALLSLTAVALMTVFGAGALATWHQRTMGPSAAGPSELKVLGFNTLRRNTDLAGIETLLRNENADVVVLLEFSYEKAVLLERLRDLYPHRASCHHDLYCGVTLLSRLPITASGSGTRKRNQGPPQAWAELMTAHGPVTVFGVHVMRPIDSPRRHWLEMDWLAASVSAVKTPVIVIGDMNSTPTAHSQSRFVRGSGLNRVSGWMPSWPVDRYHLVPQLPIDHAFASEGIRTRDVWLGPPAGSDHLPLLAIFDLSNLQNR